MQIILRAKESSCLFYNSGMSFSRTWESFPWNVTIKEKSAPPPSFCERAEAKLRRAPVAFLVLRWKSWKTRAVSISGAFHLFLLPAHRRHPRDSRWCNWVYMQVISVILWLESMNACIINHPASVDFSLCWSSIALVHIKLKNGCKSEREESSFEQLIFVGCSVCARHGFWAPYSVNSFRHHSNSVR